VILFSAGFVSGICFMFGLMFWFAKEDMS